MEPLQLPLKNIPVRAKRRFITLIETMVVAFLIVMVATLVAIPFYRSFATQKFLTETDLLLERFRFAQELMLFGGDEIKVELKQRDQGYDVLVTVEDLILDPVMKESLKRVSKPLFLKNVQEVSYEGKPLLFFFESGGFVYPEGKLCIKGAREQQRTLHFFGFPTPLIFDRAFPYLEEERVRETDQLQQLLRAYL